MELLWGLNWDLHCKTPPTVGGTHIQCHPDFIILLLLIYHVLLSLSLSTIYSTSGKLTEDKSQHPGQVWGAWVHISILPSTSFPCPISKIHTHMMGQVCFVGHWIGLEVQEHLDMVLVPFPQTSCGCSSSQVLFLSSSQLIFNLWQNWLCCGVPG